MVSKQGRNLILVIAVGLLAGYVLSHVEVDGFPLIFLFMENSGLVYSGWVWQLVTSVFVAPAGYLGLLDVVLNSVSLLFLDRFLAAVYTPRQYYAVFLSTAVLGNVASLRNGPAVTSFGASGGIFGLLAGAVSYDYAVTGRLNTPLLTWFAVIFVYSSLGASVDWLAHVGGAASGLAVGYFIGGKRRDARTYYV